MAAGGSDDKRGTQRDAGGEADAQQQTTSLQDSRPAARFVNVTDSIDEALKKSTVGLVSLSDFQKTKEELEEEKRKQAAKTAAERISAEKKAKKNKKKQRAMLSFADEEEDTTSAGTKRSAEGEDEASAKKKKVLKNPTVDTSFLPDREREEQERREREELRQTWLAEQERIKNEVIEITYSYWDGSGHRKTVECRKGDDIAAFLSKCRAQIPELRGTSVDNMMYIKEDLIIPHHYTFYDFIINKARGKSGPLFNFDVHDDVRLMSDATKEKDESHAGKVVERSWYNRFKHIFPASRWEVYDPDKDYGSYKIA